MSVTDWTTIVPWITGDAIAANRFNGQYGDNLTFLHTLAYPTQTPRGLIYRTHPDSSKALSQTWFTADEIVMDDGTRTSGWAAVATDISVSGAGGRDTGAEVSGWYEQYAIAKPDGTKSSLLHLAKAWVLDQSMTTNDTDQSLRDQSTTTKISQSFVQGATGLLEIMDARLSRNGSPVGNFWVTVEADSSGSPSGTPLATSDKMDASRIVPVGVASETIRIAFRTPATLTSGTTYWLVLQADFAINASNFIRWHGKLTSGYASGKCRIYNGTSWSDSSLGDLYFSTFVTRASAAVTMPSGYTKKALIGWAYNDASLNLTPFIANGRRVRYTLPQSMGNGGTAVPQLASAAAILPPVPVRFQPTVGHSSAGGSTIFGGLPEGWDYAGTTVNGAAAFRQSQRLADAAAFGAPHLPGEFIATEFQCIYWWVSGSTGYLNIVQYEW